MQIVIIFNYHVLYYTISIYLNHGKDIDFTAIQNNYILCYIIHKYY